MAAGRTYTPIATTTLGSAASSITFSSIPATYTDLRIVYVGGVTTATIETWLRINSDTATNYSQTNLYGNGSTGGSTKATNGTYIVLSDTSPGTVQEFISIDIFSYAGSTYKSLLVTDNNDKNGSGMIWRNVGLWRSTSAITTVSLIPQLGTFLSGSSATLYGILAA